MCTIVAFENMAKAIVKRSVYNIFLYHIEEYTISKMVEFSISFMMNIGIWNTAVIRYR